MLYTRDVHKKQRHRKRWLDGELGSEGDGWTLRSEDGSVVFAGVELEDVQAGADISHAGVEIEVDAPVEGGDGIGKEAAPAPTAAVVPAFRRRASPAYAAGAGRGFKRPNATAGAATTAMKRPRAPSASEQPLSVATPMGSEAVLRPAPPEGRSLAEVHAMLLGAVGGGRPSAEADTAGGGQPVQSAPRPTGNQQAAPGIPGPAGQPVPGPAGRPLPGPAGRAPGPHCAMRAPMARAPASSAGVAAVGSDWKPPRTSGVARPLSERSVNVSARSPNSSAPSRPASFAVPSLRGPAVPNVAAGPPSAPHSLHCAPATLGELRFCAAPPTPSPPSRDIPVEYDGPLQYARTFAVATLAEVTAHLADTARRYAAVAKHLASGAAKRAPPRCKHGATRFGITKKEGKNKGRPYFMCAQGDGPKCFFEWADAPKGKGHRGRQPEPAEVDHSKLAETLRSLNGAQMKELESAARKSDVKLYLSSGTSVERAPGAIAGGYSLHLGNAFESSAAMGLHDLWVVASDASFTSSGASWCGLFRNSFHGALDGGSTVRLLALGRAPCDLSQGPNFRRIPCAAIRVANIQNEIALMEMLERLPSVAQFAPIVQMLMRRSDEQTLPPLLPPGVASRASTAASNHLAQLAVDRDLNPEQKSVLSDCSSWLSSSTVVGFAPRRSSDASESVCAAQLVHGAFGAGKSHTLAAAVTMLARALDDAKDDTTRILVAGATNSAVDTVLRGLQRAGYTGFVRVGSMRRIHTDILPHAVHSATGGDEKATAADAIKEIQTALREARSRRQRAALMRELENARSDVASSRRSQVATARVVGVTIASASNASLEGQRFRIVVLDEASQMIEPQSMLPIVRFGAERVLAAGDPMQLPPILKVLPPASDHNGGLSRTLFSRLAKIGAVPTLLACTYRCHPALLRVPNVLFYGRRLRCGAAADDRSALIEGLEPSTFVDVPPSRPSGRQEQFNSSPAEADTAAFLLKRMVEAGLNPEQLGVICIFRAQVNLVRRALDALGGDVAGVDVSTVDAFQGQEREIILVSVGRSDGDLKFVEAPERLNVTITRARRHLIVLGRADKLRRSKLYREILESSEVISADDATAMFEHVSLTAAARESQQNDSEDEHEEVRPDATPRVVASPPREAPRVPPSGGLNDAELKVSAALSAAAEGLALEHLRKLHKEYNAKQLQQTLESLVRKGAAIRSGDLWRRANAEPCSDSPVDLTFGLL